jgi:hypothetical protein
VRDHYLGWLDKVRPDLGALHRARFRHGAYQPADIRDHVAEVVRTEAARHGIHGREPYARVAPVTIAPSAQLSLL